MSDALFSADSLSRLLTSPVWFVLQVIVPVYLVVRSVEHLALKRSGMERTQFLRNVVLCAEVLAFVGVVGAANLVGSTIRLTTEANHRLAEQDNARKIATLGSQLSSRGNCWYSRPGDDRWLSMRLTETCAISRAVGELHSPFFESSKWLARIDTEIPKQWASSPVEITLMELRDALKEWLESKNQTYWRTELQTRLNATRSDIWFLWVALFCVVFSVSLKIGRAWTERRHPSQH